MALTKALGGLVARVALALAERCGSLAAWLWSRFGAHSPYPGQR